MKKTILILLVSLHFVPIQGQNKYCGTFRDYFGECFKINSDYTFEFTYSFDLIESWSNGRWEVNSDTISFEYIPVLDTLIYNDSIISVDTLILSENKVSETIRPEEIEYFAMSGLLYQNRLAFPEKLYFRKNKLYGISIEGKLRKKRVKHILTKEKSPPWFVKEIE